MAFYTFSATFITPKIGVGNVVAFVLLGQLCALAVIDHFGLMGAPQFSMTSKRAACWSSMVCQAYSTGRAIALAAVFTLQRLVAVARKRANASFVDNRPAILMIGENMLDDVLTRTRVTADDVRGKLREANVIDLSEVHLVVLEATGDVSVLHGSDGVPLDARLVEGVEGANDALARLDAARPGSVRYADRS